MRNSLRDRAAVAPKPGLEEEADCISAGWQARLEDIDGYAREDRQGEKEAQVQGTAPQPVPTVCRPRAFLRKFELCRLCFRKLALQGDIAGVTKSSW